MFIFNASIFFPHDVWILYKFSDDSRNLKLVKIRASVTKPLQLHEIMRRITFLRVIIFKFHSSLFFFFIILPVTEKTPFPQKISPVKPAFHFPSQSLPISLLGQPILFTTHTFFSTLTAPFHLLICLFVYLDLFKH